jgi:GTPase SAR1 family protein
MTNPKSFEDVDFWVQQLLSETSYELPKILLGNKSDLSQQVSEKEALKKADQYGMKLFICSAKENRNIEQSFRLLA